MNIILVNHHFHQLSGQGRVNFEIAKRLLANGLSVHAIAYSVDDELLSKGIIWHKIKEPRLLAIFKYSYFVRKANKEAKKLNGIFIANGYTLTSKHQINIAHFVHQGWLESQYNKIDFYRLKDVYRRVFTLLHIVLENASFRQAENIIAVSDRIEDELKAKGICKERLSVIYNGVDSTRFSPCRERAFGRKAIFIGDMLSEIKNFRLLIKAWSKIPDWRLDAYGKHEKSAPAKIFEVGASNVRLMSFAKNIENILPKYDLLMLPSLYDPCPMVVLEAMSSGVPVIVSNECGNSGLVGDGGYVIDQILEPEQLLQIISRLSPKALANMSQNARTIAESYDWDIVFEDYWKIIKKYLK